jgi:hypothetical protein
MLFRTILLALLLQQADDFQKRVRIDGNKVRVDDQVLHDGPWKDAKVDVTEFTGSGQSRPSARSSRGSRSCSAWTARSGSGSR